MKKKKLLKTLLILIALWLILFTTDLVRAHNKRPPIFSISFIDYDVSSGYVGYTGLFYKVHKKATEENGEIKIDYKIYPWFY